MAARLAERMDVADEAPQRCSACLVRDSALCGSMSDAELGALSEIGRRRTVPAGQVVTWAGDAAASCANVVSGALKLSASTEDGREQIVGLIFPGDFVGELFGDEAPLTITTLTETDLCSYPRASFERVLDRHPRMERMLLRRTMASLNEARERTLALGRCNAQERVAGFLLDLCGRAGVPDAEGAIRIRIPVSRGEIADYLGLTIETVSRQFTRLKADGVIAFAKGDRDCRICDRVRLEVIARPA